MSYNQKRIFKLGGYDISKYVIEKISAFQSKPDWGELPDTSRMEIIVRNDNGTFSTMNSRALTYNKSLPKLKLEILTVQGELLQIEWAGFLENILEDYSRKQARIIGISPLSLKLQSPALIPLSRDTPANLSRQLFELYNIKIDETSFQQAHNFQTGLVTALIDPNLKESSATLMQVQQQLALAGFSRIYSVNGKMTYEVFREANPPISFSLEDKHIFDYPQVASEDNEPPTGFRVKHLGGELVSPDDGQDGKVTLDFGPNGIVKLTDGSSAQVVADRWMKIAAISSKRVELSIDSKVGSAFNLSTRFNLSWKGGGWQNILLETQAVDFSDDRYVLVTARTV